MCNSLCRKVCNVAGTHCPGFIGAMSNVSLLGQTGSFKLVKSKELTTYSGYGVVVFFYFFIVRMVP